MELPTAGVQSIPSYTALASLLMGLHLRAHLGSGSCPPETLSICFTGDIQSSRNRTQQSSEQLPDSCEPGPRPCPREALCTFSAPARPVLSWSPEPPAPPPALSSVSLANSTPGPQPTLWVPWAPAGTGAGSRGLTGLQREIGKEMGFLAQRPPSSAGRPVPCRLHCFQSNLVFIEVSSRVSSGDISPSLLQVALFTGTPRRGI